MARNWYGKRVVRKEDKYTRKITFTTYDEYWEYFKMFLMILAALTYAYFLFR